MSTQTTRTIRATVVMRAWIIGGLGALIVLVVLMIQPPASAGSAARAATQPCATSVSASALHAKCAPCVKRVASAGGCQRTA